MSQSVKRPKPSFLDARENSVDGRARPRPNARVNLETLIGEDSECFSSRSPSPNGDRRSDSPVASEERHKEEDTVRVCLRLRPHLKNVPFRSSFRVEGNSLVARGADDVSIERQYTFSEIFTDTATQSIVYENSIRQPLANLTGDRGATFLTYGTSGSGKTYTLLGTNSSPGIVPRAIEQIFVEHELNISAHPSMKVDKAAIVFLDDDSVFEERKKVDYMRKVLQASDCSHVQMRSVIQNEHNFQPKGNSDLRVFIWVSYFEIYNENVYDLLDREAMFGKKKPMKIVANEGNAYIKDLTCVYAGNSEEAFNILQFGLQSATYGSTDVNLNSSRSHSIFSLTVLSYTISSQHISYSVYKFCDLAGSERLKKTGTFGDRLKEAQKINTSLMVLGRCLETVHKNQKSKRLAELVPVRDSKLTMIIQSALLGREKLTMIVNLYPIEEYFDENLNVLKFSSIAKQVVLQRKPTAGKTNRTTRFSFFLAQATSSPSVKTDALLLEEIESLRRELQERELEVSVYQEQLADRDREIQLLKRELYKQELQLRNELTDNFEVHRKQREERFKTRLKQAEEAAALPYKLQNENLLAKIQELKNTIEDMEDEEEDYERKLNVYKKELRKYKEKESRIRRMSL